MEKKQLTTRQWATIKRIAQNTLPAIQRAERLKKYVEEYEDLLAQIEADNSAAMRMSGGYTASELILREVVDYVDKQTGEVKVDKDGRALKLTKWVPNTEIVSFDAEKNVYFVEPKVVEQPTEE